ncbi:hypothetical protein A3A93_01765 [Candidatus Roizmanbacteria bacterium RIFCSPLOWO2_01_FULL_38_12]|uniref:Uncharacterized protein n=1 Tax=Candidatus Roizmanbacteria bacterium RIFCSPLOWO2_01_FULL_38_12 TaxID=1802061 RepID=A0A1F7IYA5_9BACT|nr:MAG: hypothetical protein A2861_02230 [Candidatus Roizmanbacteria bacterium RIFCSPHIGHO2_01_FULL_38_15]OGK34515.1 MAG: hypothetical protein A3F59_04295 [Candidatus Roizmanbacteria bacterium RIFCSPHIGHO2_12_FULL_38_13]OGK48344.1 MAG: hypothetical protein A3A93_01765 [Candidatus Roizmanbacteria bacterium RIFCSPLOWO2_01_FULL_38_12]
MENIINFFTSTDSNTILMLFFKAFAVLFSLMYLLYAIVLTRQTQIMNRTVTTQSAPVLLAFSAVQIIFALFLIFVSFVLI